MFKNWQLDPTKFLLTSRLAWQAAWKKTEVKLELFIDIDIVLMVENGIRVRTCHYIHKYVKANNKYM